MGPHKREAQPGYYLTGQVVVAQKGTHICVPYKEFRLPARSRFGEGRGALHLGIFDQPGENEFLKKL